ncbi:hypothetical protein ACU635_25140 [[Actinomadura] parvosata]
MRAHALTRARLCYDHLAGAGGAAVTRRLFERERLRRGRARRVVQGC